MPPEEPLPPETVVAFREWIQNGAVYPDIDVPVDLMAAAREHWAFHAPESPPLPTATNAAWPQTDVDTFILARLEAAGLQPSPPAGRRTLIRRLSFDLLGLPPTPEEVEAFVADADPEAYAGLVERYLASPHYGERWARHWLDVARYADTKGYVYGREEVEFVHAHVYRDWVVRALNADMPYDRFLRMQLAADTFDEEATPDDLAAMGFLTLGQRFLGVKPDIIDDRIDTVTRGLMGLTVSCARCHDHKFDPIPTEDYYSLYGVFSASSERRAALHADDLADVQFATFTGEMTKRQNTLRETFASQSEALEARLRGQVDRYLTAVPNEHELPTDDFYEIRDDDDLNPTIVRRWAAHINGQGPDDPIFGIWNRLTHVPQTDFVTDAAAVIAEFKGSNSAIRDALVETPPHSFKDVVDCYALVFKSLDDEWLTLLEASGEDKTSAPTRLPNRDREAIRQSMLAKDSPIQVQDGAIVDLEWMFAEPARVELAELYAEIDRWIVNADTAPPYAVILVDKPGATLPRVFLRGSPANPGPEVPRQFLALLSGDNRQPFDKGSGRREMAEAIASPENPLTARVFVNRVWAWHFGAGLVTTPSDFGTRSAAPSHPNLLDWLAIRFVEDGWSLKQLHRLIVLSSTYRQQGVTVGDTVRTARAETIDPENRLLWNFNRRRLDFESLRDALLSASGEMDLALGGRPVDLVSKPYPVRRTLYGRVDRRYLPPLFRAFDFPSPDMHSPQRHNTTVPQQALFLLNNAFVQVQSRALAARSAETNANADATRINWMYRQVLQRTPEPNEIEQGLEFVTRAKTITPPPPPEPRPTAWTYGYGTINEASSTLDTFTPFPHFTGTAWQGGSSWPDATLGWAQLTAEGGHPGNNLNHAVIRRWTAPVSGRISIEGRIKHARTEGDGIRAWLFSSKQGVLGTWFLHNNEVDANVYGVHVEAGDTIDFVVDIRKVLNSDEYLWSPTIRTMVENEDAEPSVWSAQAEFAGIPDEPIIPLTAWEKYAQVLLCSNEFLFVD
jgi:hypothetical protein